MKAPKLDKTSLYEKHIKKVDNLQEGVIPYSVDERNEFLREIKQYSEMGGQVYRSMELVDMTNRLEELIEKACKMNIKETEQWFDNLTVKRHNKRLQETFKVFKKTAHEMTGLQQRLEAAYDDMGQLLNKYYEL